jgi:two-component system, LytTR family, response regulator
MRALPSSFACSDCPETLPRQVPDDHRLACLRPGHQTREVRESRFLAVLERHFRKTLSFFDSSAFHLDESTPRTEPSRHSMKCLIADDDPLICETLETFLQQLGGVEMCLKVGDGLTALQLTQSERFDVVFLDLQMPGLDGVSLLKALPRETAVIVISADPGFGAASYEFGVVDYLVKPVTLPRLAQAMQKIRARSDDGSSRDGDTVFIKDGTRIVKVELPRLLFIKAEANYVDFVTETGNTLTLMSMKRLEELLPADFMRIHRSYIVNIQRITRIEDGCVHIEKHKLPIGDNYREEVVKRLNVLS